jgi:hypothetical protein
MTRDGRYLREESIWRLELGFRRQTAKRGVGGRGRRPGIDRRTQEQRGKGAKGQRDRGTQRARGQKARCDRRRCCGYTGCGSFPAAQQAAWQAGAGTGGGQRWVVVVECVRM